MKARFEEVHATENGTLRLFTDIHSESIQLENFNALAHKFGIKPICAGFGPTTANMTIEIDATKSQIEKFIRTWRK